MRLTAIKLAGFKSFVDPTTFEAPTNLTGIVGPNGCGKSNVIDAIRWVMGEGSAKVLRGESMSDVIFSGSSGRKPVGTATVELLFDNSECRVGGQFAAYTEISVKRQISRDGVSIYVLNGTRCRRKDIRDLFLGTGLGSRSYSIIEQGMISEIVDARPEDIRAHLEEAAGISRYKERRRETERRISHTRDNLARLSDLRDEVGKHLGRLKRQAYAANRYHRLQQEKRELESRLLALQWRELRSLGGSGREDLAKQETALQGSIASQRAAEAELEKLHDKQALATESFGEVQGKLYEVGSEIVRLEQNIAHARELQLRQQSEFEETKTALGDLRKHLGLDQAQVEDLTQSLAEFEPALKLAQDAEAAASAALVGAEAAVADWQKNYEQHHSRRISGNSEADQVKAEVELLDQRLLDATGRLEALDKEARSIDTTSLMKEVKALGVESAALAKEEEKGATGLTGLQEKTRSLIESRDVLVARLGTLRRDLHTGEGRLASLQALQDAALNHQDHVGWLQRTGVDQAPALAQNIDVARGWEVAVETVLGHWLEAKVMQPGLLTADMLKDVDNLALGVVDDSRGAIKARRGSLSEQVEAPDGVIAWLNAVKVATSLDQAFELREQLTEGESVVTQAGEWLGMAWMRVARGSAGRPGMLERENEISALQSDLKKISKELVGLEKKSEATADKLNGLRQDGDQRREEVIGLHRRRNEIDGRLNSLNANRQMLKDRQVAIGAESDRLRAQMDRDQGQVRKKRGQLEVLLERMAELQLERDALESRREGLMSARDSIRSAAHAARNERHQLDLKTGARRASLDSLRQSLERMDTQLSQVQQRYLKLSEQVATAQPPEKTHSTEMEALLQRRLETENQLSEARQALQQLEQDYRGEDARRQAAVQLSEERRADLERAKLKQQELELSAKSVRQKIEELGGEAEALAEDIPATADSEAWRNEIELLQTNITRLEPVNLAAIQEFDEEKKRKDYLDEQNNDLCEALTTLEDAIAKIDRKTRTRFKDTFEEVNKGVQELFPRLFGGGHGYLELTGEDLLTTGVGIMARPPGKRVSSIHLLSGGEKALTAVAFVFAIFRLNPAPFCLLDEVDAPLDDANVARFCSMVSEMAETVQFIFVTHNKITMEMAHQMSGVTMREPGVSRLVQVDIDQAARMARE